jgi:hypothetical protein
MTGTVGATDAPIKKPDTTRPLLIATGYLGFGLIAALTLVPAQFRLHTGAGGPAEHCIAYAFVGVAYGLGYRTLRPQMFSGLAFTIGAALLELLQNFTPDRNSEIIGFLASSIGAWIGLAVAFFAAAFLRLVPRLAQTTGELGAVLSDT